MNYEWYSQLKKKKRLCTYFCKMNGIFDIANALISLAFSLASVSLKNSSQTLFQVASFSVAAMPYE